MGALLDLALQAVEKPLSLSKDHEERLKRAAEMVREVPTRRAAYIAGVESGGIVPVTVVIRTAKGLVTGELPIPKDRWDPFLFLRFLQEQDKGLLA